MWVTCTSSLFQKSVPRPPWLVPPTLEAGPVQLGVINMDKNWIHLWGGGKMIFSNLLRPLHFCIAPLSLGVLPTVARVERLAPSSCCQLCVGQVTLPAAPPAAGQGRQGEEKEETRGTAFLHVSLRPFLHCSWHVRSWCQREPASSFPVLQPHSTCVPLPAVVLPPASPYHCCWGVPQQPSPPAPQAVHSTDWLLTMRDMLFLQQEWFVACLAAWQLQPMLRAALSPAGLFLWHLSTCHRATLPGQYASDRPPWGQLGACGTAVWSSSLCSCPSGKLWQEASFSEWLQVLVASLGARHSW